MVKSGLSNKEVVDESRVVKEGKSWRMKKLGGLTSLDVKIERDKTNGEEEKDL